MAVTTRKRPIKYRRGKPLPELRHGDVIDMTTFPLHSKPDGRPVEVCPKCGRKGERTIYVKTGAQHYTHSKRFDSIFWMTLESCTVGAIG